MKLEGKVALITGAGSGIGQAIALLFAREGADIAVNDIDTPSAQATVARVRRTGRKAIATMADVSNPGDVGAMVSATISELGGIHLLVNNAGVQPHGSMIEHQTVEMWDRVVAVVMRGTYLCTRRVGQWMAANGGGKVINIASVAGLVGVPDLASYGAAKAGVVNLTRSLAVEWGKYKINVNAIAPGLIDTPLTRHTSAAWSTPERIAEQIPLGRMGEPEEVARAALFLASDDASYVTGVTLPVDGGRLA